MERVGDKVVEEGGTQHAPYLHCVESWVWRACSGQAGWPAEQPPPSSCQKNMSEAEDGPFPPWVRYAVDQGVRRWPAHDGSAEAEKSKTS